MIDYGSVVYAFMPPYATVLDAALLDIYDSIRGINESHYNVSINHLKFLFVQINDVAEVELQSPEVSFRTNFFSHKTGLVCKCFIPLSLVEHKNQEELKLYALQIFRKNIEQLAAAAKRRKYSGDWAGLTNEMLSILSNTEYPFRQDWTRRITIMPTRWSDEKIEEARKNRRPWPPPKE